MAVNTPVDVDTHTLIGSVTRTEVTTSTGEWLMRQNNGMVWILPSHLQHGWPFTILYTHPLLGVSTANPQSPKWSIFHLPPPHLHHHVHNHSPTRPQNVGRSSSIVTTSRSGDRTRGKTYGRPQPRPRRRRGFPETLPNLCLTIWCSHRASCSSNSRCICCRPW